jgi:hypothetical protein
MSEALHLAGLHLGRTVTAADVADPLLNAQPATEAPVRLWRPLLPDPTAAEVLLPVLPFAMAGAPQVVCFRGKLAPDFPEQDPVSGVLLAGLLRSIHELQRFVIPEWLHPGLLDGCAGWRQEQVYIIPEFDLGHYDRIFETFMDAQVLLSPEEPYLSILPGGEISKGELGKMIGLFRRYPGE